MFSFFKLWNLGRDLQRRGNPPAAFSAVLELGRIGSDRAIDLLLRALERRDGVARSAARELGRLAPARAVSPLIVALADPEVNQSAAEALAKFGSKAVPALGEALGLPDAPSRRLAAAALGQIGEAHAVDPLIRALEGDADFLVRAGAATALGQIKDRRAIWALVNALKLRDEADPARQAALGQLRQAATLAMRKMGDPLAEGRAGEVPTVAGAMQRLEQGVVSAGVHPRLLGDVVLLSEAELIGVLRELINASEEVSWARLESRTAVLPEFFASYEQRRRAAEIAGRELHRRGGGARLQQALAAELDNYASLANWWREEGWLV